MPFLPILLPDGFYAIVEQKDSVKIGQILAQRDATQEILIDLASQLNVPKHTAFTYVLKNPGDTFEAGEVIAQQKKFLSRTKKVVSKTAGTVTRIERNTGEMYIVQNEKEVKGDTIVSPIEGTVALCNNGKILIDTDKDVIDGQIGTGQSGVFELLVLPDSESVEPYHVQADAIGKIIIGSYFSKEILLKSIGMGVSGIIAQKVIDNDIDYLKSKNLTVPIIEISADDLHKLKRWKGKMAFVDGEGKSIILLHK